MWLMDGGRPQPFQAILSRQVNSTAARPNPLRFEGDCTRSPGRKLSFSWTLVALRVRQRPNLWFEPILTILMSETPSTLDRIVDRCGRLYSLPVVAMRVLELTTSPTVNVKALKDCIENDPALTSKVLRVVNSSLFGLSREVTNLNQALALLGTTPLKLLVLGFSL